MRRKPGTLLPLEVDILSAALALRGRAPEGVHGFLLAKAMADAADARRLTAHGTLYKALRRLEGAGMLTSRWEVASRALAEGRPRRRLYRITRKGAAACTAALESRGARDVGRLARA